MAILNKDLLTDLTERTNQIIKTVETTFIGLTIEQLNKKPSAEAWSIIECLAHLNNYGGYYLPQIAEKIKNSRHSPTATFKSGWLGNYFANTMIVKDDKINKMSSPKKMNPVTANPTQNSALDKVVIITFLAQQKQLLEHLTAAKNSNLTKIKIPITLAKWIKLRLGDTFRFVIYHNERHILQARKIVDSFQ